MRRPGHPSSPPHLNHVAQRLPADNPLHVIRPPLQRGAHLGHVVVPVVDAGDAGHTVPEHAFRDDVLDATSNRHRAPKTLGIFVSPKKPTIEPELKEYIDAALPWRSVAQTRLYQAELQASWTGKATQPLLHFSQVGSLD